MESLNKTKKVIVDEIIVDPNFELSEDTKFGQQLAKNPAEWYRYFNQPLPTNIVKSSVFDGEEFDKLFN
jgi:hypothetical protein